MKRLLALALALLLALPSALAAEDPEWDSPLSPEIIYDYSD